jgi:hypothetical protein
MWHYSYRRLEHEVEGEADGLTSHQDEGEVEVENVVISHLQRKMKVRISRTVSRVR